MIAIDRAMLVNGSLKANVESADTREEAIDVATPRLLLDQRSNRGAAVVFQLPGV